MVEFTFTSDVSALNDKQQEFIKNALENIGIKSGKIEIKSVGTAADNYVANVKRIIVDSNGEEFRMIAKIAPTNEAVRRHMRTKVCFTNEKVMYSEVLPQITELERKAGVPVEDRLKYAKFYGCYMEAPNEVILLEDLAVSDFTMLDRFVSLSDENIKLVLRDLAKLHSASYALKKLQPENFKKYSKKLLSIWELIATVPNTTFYLKAICKDLMNLLDKKYVKVVDEALNGLLNEAVNLSKAHKGKVHSVIQQGDPWTNNLLFKTKVDKTECCMIDYQLSNESSPIADITYLIFNCTDYETRAKHFNAWLDYYHSELKKHLEYYELKIEFIYPRSQLDRDMKIHAKFSLGQSILIASMVMRESKDASQLKKRMEDEVPVEEMARLSFSDDTLAKLKNKVTGLVDTFLDFGFLGGISSLKLDCNGIIASSSL